MTLHINDPKFFKERSESKPLSLEEQKEAVYFINQILISAEKDYGGEFHYSKPLIQRLLHHYENLQALSDFIGGWEGATRVINIVDPMPDTEK